MKMNKESIKDIMKFSQKFGIAADCVVNDTLVNIDTLDPILMEPTEISGRPQLVYGRNMVKQDCEDLTAMDVFYMLPDDPMGQSIDDHDMWQSFFNADGSLNDDFVDAIKGFIEDHMESSALSDEELDQLDKMKEDLKNSNDPTTQRKLAGRGIGGKKKPITKTNDNMRWNMLMADLVEINKFEDTWNRPSRKLSSFYPEVLLPKQKDQEVQKIIAFIDSSGSMSKVAVNKLTNVLRNAPDHIKIQAVAFDTRCYEFDLKTEEPVPGGGTSFYILEQYLQRMTHYPKAVFVLTDGYGDHVTPQFPKRWVWLLYGGGSNELCKDMKNFRVEDLLK
jgi:predicted metal-dependent peptidase